jgi:hypothetical protein
VNELLAAILVGVLLSISAGVRITLPLLALNLLAYEHVIRLPDNMTWLGTQTTLILLCAAFVVETTVHFMPVAGTALKAAATPLAFVAGTLLMAVPLGDKNPLFQWVLAGSIGGGMAALTHLGLTGMRVATGPVNLASGGIFGIGWNLLELFGSLFFIVLSGICVVAGWIVGALLLLALAVLLVVIVAQARRQWRERAGMA